MHTDKNTGSQPGSESVEPNGESQGSNLNWLVDMDLSEPEERLFTVDESSQVDTGLTEYEMEVARRPMTRGSAGADDLESYIDEEIVISSDSSSNDIYSNGSNASPAAQDTVKPDEEPMAIDYSRAQPRVGDVGREVTEGADILGLADDDDIGEKYFVVKRVPAETGAKQSVAETTDAPHSGSSTSVASADGTSEAAGAGNEVAESTDSTETTEGFSAAADENASEDSSDLTISACESGNLEEAEPPISLSEAPVLKLVSQDTPLAVANDDLEMPVDATDTDAAEADTTAAMSPELPGNDVFGYIAETSPPTDEQAFDEYLLKGEQLDTNEPMADDLILSEFDGEDWFDATPDEAIDYHDDFQQLSGFDDQAVANVAPHLPGLMEELSVALEGRLEALGMASGSVQAELMVGEDAVSIDQLIAQGYEPAVAVCNPPLVALQELRQSDVDALYIRLLDTETGQVCNGLFDEVVQPEVPTEGAALEETLVQGDLADVLVSTEVDDDTFDLASGDDLAEQRLPEDMEIDNIFSDFVGAGETQDEDESVQARANGSADLSDDVQSGDFRIFAEDIFAEELSSASEQAALEPQADIDALFESLGLEQDEPDEICGVDVEEFSGAVDKLHLVAESEQAAVKPEPEVSDATVFSCIPAGIVFSQASVGGGEIFSDFLDAFVEEGSSELEKLEDAVTAWEKDASSEAAFVVVTRVLHTIKGIAKGVGLHFYGTLIHNFETLLSSLPRPEEGAESDYFRIVNAWLDACVRGLDHIQDAREDISHELPQAAGQTSQESAQVDPEPDSETVTEQPSQAVTPAPEPVSRVTDPRAAQQSKKIADEGAKALAAQQSVRITSEKLDHLLNLSNQAQQLSVRTAQSVTRGKRASTEMQSRLSSVRAHISAIADRALRSVAAQGVQPGTPMDALEMDQYTELQEAANILREGVEDLADLVEFATRQNTQVEALLKQQTNVISSIGSSIRGARVVPVSRLIPGLRRLVRTVSVDLNKVVSFRVINELGTLDRDDYARCQTILDHMVRNALDHGIEQADERVSAGKPAEGQVTIDIRKAGADSIITLSDDGRGIDPEKMRESAISKGLDVDVDALSDAEATRLIFHKGFSTASSISQISGRGVGMDIVLSELQEMGGDIQIDSVPGRGTSFHIRVPSCVTVNGALLVSAGEQSYAIPLGGLIAVEQVPVDDFFAAVQNKSTLMLGDLECEPAYLATLCQNGHPLDAKTWRGDVPVIIAGTPERRMAVAIDDVEEALELVIRSLGSQFSSVPGVAGAATTAAGEAIVALDLNLLVASVGEDDQSTLQVDAARDESLLVMVVDDSRTQRKVATSQLETVGVETITAENGAVAIDLLNSADRLPDIILMDVEMPVKDGIQALREIRKSVRYAEVPVIMITSRTGLKHRAMAQAAGCNGYMGKPFNFRMLIGQINELTGHRLQLS